MADRSESLIGGELLDFPLAHLHFHCRAGVGVLAPVKQGKYILKKEIDHLTRMADLSFLSYSSLASLTVLPFCFKLK